MLLVYVLHKKVLTLWPKSFVIIPVIKDFI